MPAHLPESEAAKSSPLGYRSDTLVDGCVGDAPPRIVTVEVTETESLLLVVTGAEREALLRVFYVVKDNFWLDDVEEALLERLLEPLANCDPVVGYLGPTKKSWSGMNQIGCQSPDARGSPASGGGGRQRRR